MQNKFNMTREQNIFLAKRNIIDNIYRSARLEGIAVTYPETAILFEGRILSTTTIPEMPNQSKPFSMNTVSTGSK